jgi:hypothetical protein
MNLNNEPSDLASASSFSKGLIEALDLVPLIQKVAAHAGTRRGRQALLSLVEYDDDSSKSKGSGSLHSRNSQLVASKKHRAVMENRRDSNGKKVTPPFSLKPCTSAEQVRAEYDLMEQAAAALQGVQNTTFPPLYSAESNPYDTKTIPETDDDEWLLNHHKMAMEDWTLEHILQAEQVTAMLLRVAQWAARPEIQMWMPLLAEIGANIDTDAIAAIQDEIAGSVEIARVRSIMDPTGRSSFTFRINPDKFRILQLLRERESDMREKVVATKSSPNNWKLVQDLQELEQELVVKEAEIQVGLAQAIYGSMREIDQGLNIVAQLDTIFARAAFGESRNGRRPIVKSEGRIDVRQFVHPLLEPESSKATKTKRAVAVPVDLHLSSDKNERALIISGPNGGGKTLAMKSFGVVCVLCKLGIAIPTMTDNTAMKTYADTQQLGPLRADYFDEILVSVGDRQNVQEGQSTFMAQLNAFSGLIETVCLESETVSPHSHLILIDELGGGTEANAGGAIAQAVLEKLLGTRVCHIVVTTHSARLKALSFDNDEFSCATVLLRKDNGDDSEYRLPAFELQYGVIGESYALGAASRCMPQLPEDVLARAANLMATSNEETGDSSGEYVRTLTRSLEKHAGIADSARIEAEMSAINSVKCQKAMLSLATAYDRHLALLEERIERCFQELKSTKSPTDLLGETLSELRVVKRQVQSEKDILRERGLKILPNSHKLEDGASIFIVKEGYDGVGGKVVTLDPSLGQELKSDEVAVSPTLTMWEAMSLDDPMYSESTRPVVFKRYELAIWDFDSVWDYGDGDDSSYTSVKDSKRQLNDVLSRIKTETPSSQTRAGKPAKAEAEFTSSRQRKAQKKKRNK